MDGIDLFYRMSNSEIMKLSDEDKIAFVFSYLEKISYESAKKTLKGVEIQEVKTYIENKLLDQKQAIESFQRLLESIGE